ncbi:MAG: PAS domain S-box protein [Haloferacaceae archaeon]
MDDEGGAASDADGGAWSDAGERWFRSLIAHSNDVITVLDDDWTIRYRSPSVERVLGRRPEEQVGEAVLEHVHPDDRAAVEAALSDLDATDASIELEYRRRHADGTWVWLESTARVWDDPTDGRRPVVSSRDVTERKERERKLRRREAIIDAVPDPVWTVDTEARLRFVNQCLEEAIGAPAESLHGRKIDAVLTGLEGTSGETAGEFDRKLRAVLDGEREEVRTRVELPRGGDPVVRDVKAVPIVEEGEIVGAVGVNRDVTERAELERQREEMLDRITDMFFSVDREFRVAYVSPKTEAWLREHVADVPEEVVGEVIWDLVPGSADSVIHDHYQRALETQEPVSFECPSPMNGEWISVRAYPSETGLSIYVRDISERKERERRLRESEEKFRQLAENLDEVVWMTAGPSWDVEYVNPKYEEVWGQSREALYEDWHTFADAIHPEDRERVERALERASETGEFQEEYRIRRPDGTVRWIHDRGYAIGDGTRFVGIAEDVTDRKRHEETLERLHDTARQFMQARTEAEVYGLVAEAATDVLDLPATTIYSFDRERNVLQPVEHVGGAADAGSPDPVSAGGGVVWDAFSAAESRYITGQGAPAEDGRRTGVVIPLGNHGVVAVGVETDAALPDADDELAHLLAASAETALERTRRERTLIERDRALARKNETLDELNHVNTVIRNAIRTVVQASTHTETLQRFCERLTDGDRYRGCCFLAFEEFEEELTPEVWTGLDADYVDRVDALGAESPEDALARAALAADEVRVSPDLLDDPGWAERRDAVLPQGFHGVAAIPVRSRDLTFGCLLVYARKPGAFAEEERDVLAEAGSVVGHALLGIERTESTLTDQTVEVEVGIEDDRLFFGRLARELDCEVDLAGWLPRDDGSMLAFVSVPDATADAVESTLAGWPSVASVAYVTEHDEQTLYKVTMAQTQFTDVLGKHGAMLCSLTATDAETHCTLKLPDQGAVGDLMDALRGRYATVRLRARRETSQTTSRQSFQADLLEELTERQHEVLQAAYYGGFFEWPRESTGEAVADAVGVSPPTFHQHLRAAERKLVRAVLEG